MIGFLSNLISILQDNGKQVYKQASSDNIGRMLILYAPF